MCGKKIDKQAVLSRCWNYKLQVKLVKLFFSRNVLWTHGVGKKAAVGCSRTPPLRFTITGRG